MKGKFRSLVVGISLLFAGGLVCGLTSCGDSTPEPPTSSYETRWSPDQKDSVVYVQCANQQGSYTNFFMNYLLFRTLFDRGGYQAVYNYYQTNPNSGWNSPKYANYSPRSSFKSGYTSPSRKSTYYTSPSRSSSPSYSSPSRSSSPSYSRPSYSSPSRTYSSPSRSYSSPSRSYSSPSRH